MWVATLHRRPNASSKLSATVAVELVLDGASGIGAGVDCPGEDVVDILDVQAHRDGRTADGREPAGGGWRPAGQGRAVQGEGPPGVGASWSGTAGGAVVVPLQTLGGNGGCL
jgi:hypothetical protein